MSALRLRTWDGPDVGRASEAVVAFLERREAVHNLALGILAATRAGRDEGLRYLAAVERSGAVVAMGMRTEIKYLLAAADDPQAVDLLAADARARHPDLPGWLGPDAVAERFAQVWAREGGAASRVAMRLRVHELTAVRPAVRAAGRLRPAEPRDLGLLVAWSEGLQVAVGAPARHDPAEAARRELEAGTSVLWETPAGQTVSMAAWGGPTPHGIRIRKVYTPPEHRNRGYAEACVAALSAQLLASGRRFCFLYTDLANPTSNAVYGRVGYVPVCDAADHRTQPAPA